MPVPPGKPQACTKERLMKSRFLGTILALAAAVVAVVEDLHEAHE